MVSNHRFKVSMTVLRSAWFDKAVKPRRSAIRMAASIVSTAPRRTWPLKISSPAWWPT
jgi:hypothetical protein